MKKIAITGPESTGKSSLAQFLSIDFNLPLVKEFARDYLVSKPQGYQCSFEEISYIAAMQMKMEDELSEKYNLIICDTDILVCKIWQEYVFGYCDPNIEAAFRNRDYALFLLCDADIPWEFDPLRSNPNDRGDIFNLYKNALEKASKPFKIISGHGEQRNKNAQLELAELLK
jgi:nicotinamide riboside kinase